VLRHESPIRLVEAIRTVAGGERVVNPELALKALDAEETPLTAREIEVLQLFAGGAEAAEIAKALSLTVGTVRNYLTAIVSKVGARNRVDAIRIARQAGWLL
jgi:two-component system response regulator DesR